MPIEFFEDTDQYDAFPPETRCLAEITMFDGPGICKREKGHKVDDFADGGMPSAKELHQEQFEGWAWDVNGMVV